MAGKQRIAVFTDLDGTLLDHDTYSFEPAREALAHLKAAGHPVVIVTSKTPVEVVGLQERLGLREPFVAENGAAVITPDGYFRLPAGDRTGSLPGYPAILEILHGLREQSRYPFRGFADMTVDEVSAVTGLSTAEATMARQRVGSEPLLWKGGPEHLRDFTAAVQDAGLRITQGGRFLHVMGATDKGAAVRGLLRRFRAEQPDSSWLSVGLGDAPNDLPMLDRVDVAVVIPSARSLALSPEAAEVLRPSQPGPTGWAWAIEEILARGAQ